MGATIALRKDYDASDLRRLAKGCKDAAQIRRLLSLAEIYAGGRRTDAARIGAPDLQVIRDWVLRFNAHGPSGLLDRKAPGNPTSPGAGHSGEPGPQRRRIYAPSRPTYSVPSAPHAVSVLPSFCHAATPKPCNGISTKSRPKSVPAHMPF